MSNSDFAIKATNLSKVYSRVEGDAKKNVQFYALKNVNFELKKGEVLGVIGSNGSGKSTLLRVLSGITKPSEGKVEINGAIATILDVGTGFHPDLSGRENTYMRGQLLGMQKFEIDAVFDELVEFSGIKNFIESPVKHYSSGMFLRLAFSIIIHLRSDVLLLDEVMAVGDSAFKDKCARKIAEIVASGKTVIMVSHDLRSIMDLCSQAALMKDGEIICIDTPRTVISDSYLSKLAGINHEDSIERREVVDVSQLRVDEMGFEVQSLKLMHTNEVDANGSGSASEFNRNEDIIVEMRFSSTQPNVFCGIILTDFLSNNLIEDSPGLYQWDFTNDFVGQFSAIWTIPKGLLSGGRYYIDIELFKNASKQQIRFPKTLEFRVNSASSLMNSADHVHRSPICVDFNLKFRRV